MLMPVKVPGNIPLFSSHSTSYSSLHGGGLCTYIQKVSGMSISTSTKKF